MKSNVLKVLIAIILLACLLVFTGCAANNETVEEVVQNEVAEEVEETVNSDSKYGFVTTTSDENLTVNLEEDPRPNSFKIANDIEKNLINAGYKIDGINLGGYKTALQIEYKLGEESLAYITFSSKDEPSSIVVHSVSEETLVPLLKVILGTESMGISPEEADQMIAAKEYTKVGNWSGSTGSSPREFEVMFMFSRAFN